jgi:hypothetical protein
MRTARRELLQGASARRPPVLRVLCDICGYVTFFDAEQA